MKKILGLTAATLMWPLSIQANESKKLTPRELCQRLVVEGQAFVYDSTGTKIQAVMNETTTWESGPGQKVDRDQNEFKCVLRGRWGSRSDLFKEPLFISAQFEVKPDNTIRASIEQFADQEVDKKQGRKTDFKDSLKKEDFLIKDFAPIIWISPLHKDQRVVVRFLPTVASKSAPTDLVKIPLAIEDGTVADSKGRIWMRNFTVLANYCAFETPYGTILMSYYPFTGSDEIGRASGSKMELTIAGKHSLSLTSTAPLLPNGVNAKVYGRFVEERKIASLDQRSVHSSSDEKKFVEDFR